jgi:hypothetical protein
LKLKYRPVNIGNYPISSQREHRRHFGFERVAMNLTPVPPVNGVSSCLDPGHMHKFGPGIFVLQLWFVDKIRVHIAKTNVNISVFFADIV